MTLELVKELRNKTHIGLQECKSALEEADNNLDKALVVLQKRGLIKAGQLSSRTAGEGKVFSYIHNGKIGVMVEVNTETDFCAKAPLFVEFGENLAMHIAAFKPLYVRSDDVPAEIMSNQMAIFAEQTNKPEPSRTQIAEGKYKKWCGEVCLMHQPWIHNNKKTVEAVRVEMVSALGENISVRRIVRWEMGENK